ncbi:MAG: tRNA lysidine(34) synthetase TilS [Planctomycetota bacterium]|nr:tRNA lysidine(34) synthetase TilS [Planctomycetota bacterium]
MSGRDPLAAVLHHGLVARCGIDRPSRILVGFSGGADSTALMLLMKSLAGRAGSPVREVCACHVNHGLRAESDEEARHAVKVSSMLGVDMYVSRLVVDRDAGNLSQRARELRYEAFEKAASEAGCDYVCTAHHAEDRFETMLQHLCRGGGALGVSQPRWSRPLGSMHLVRPLLGTARTDLRSLCLRAELPFVEDPTNGDPGTARGFLRQEVIPILESRWPGAAQRASAAADRITAAGIALEGRLADCFGPASRRVWPRELFREVDPELSAAAIRRSLLDFASRANLPLEQNSFANRLCEAAWYAQSSGVEPRTFEFAAGRLRLIVTARDVALDIVTD